MIFGRWRLGVLPQRRALVDPIGRHSALKSRRPDGAPKVDKEEQADMQAFKEGYELNDPSVLNFVREFGDSPWSGVAMTIFPNLSALRQTNILNTRIIVPRGPNELMMIWAVFGRVSDDDEMTRLELLGTQRSDLIKSEENLRDAIQEIDKVAREKFLNTFNDLN